MFLCWSDLENKIPSWSSRQVSLPGILSSTPLPWFKQGLQLKLEMCPRRAMQSEVHLTVEMGPLCLTLCSPGSLCSTMSMNLPVEFKPILILFYFFIIYIYIFSGWEYIPKHPVSKPFNWKAVDLQKLIFFPVSVFNTSTHRGSREQRRIE